MEYTLASNVHAHHQKTVLAQPHTMKQLGVKQQLHVMSDITKQKHPEPYHAPRVRRAQQPVRPVPPPNLRAT